MKKTKPKLNIITGIVTMALLNIVSFSYLLNIYKFTNCLSDSECTSAIYRGAAIPIFPLGMIIGFIDFSGDSKK